MPEVKLFSNKALNNIDTGVLSTSTVCEPSVAASGNEVLLTGNWFATRSLDGGASWDSMDPFTYFPHVDGGFCCDQSVIYEPSRDITIWLLQYLRADDQENTLRVVVSPGVSIGNNVWHWWDFRPSDVDPNWIRQWFDYNHIAVSNNFAYVGTNMFDAEDVFTQCVVFRLPLDELANVNSSLSYDYYETPDNFSLRCCQGARDVMYFGSHNSNRELRLFEWREDSASVATHDIAISKWNYGPNSANGPDGRNWLARSDSRITAAYLIPDREIGFAWTANKQGLARPYPFVRCVVIDPASNSVAAEPDIWSSNFAYAYPDMCANMQGHVGVSLFRGGNMHHPGHVVGIRDDLSGGSWDLKETRASTDGPSDEKWGDYVSCRPAWPSASTWVTSGFTLQGGGSRDDIEPQYVHFGRDRNTPMVERWRRTSR